MAIGGAKLPDTQSVQTLLHIARCGAAIRRRLTGTHERHLATDRMRLNSVRLTATPRLPAPLSSHAPPLVR
jgi:hypothetical protein